jgi:hypothetical protein
MSLNFFSGLVRRLTVPSYADQATAAPGINQRGELAVVQGLPERSELVRQGNSYSAQMPAGSAWTLLITIPTTLANLSLQNPSTSGRYFIIDRFWVKAVTSMASACALTPLSQNVPPGTAMVANDATVLRTNLSGSLNAPLGALVMASVLTGCLTDKWNHHQCLSLAATTNIATTQEVQCYGRYIVPPGGSFNVNAQESVSGGTAIAGIEWHEVSLLL